MKLSNERGTYHIATCIHAGESPREQGQIGRLSDWSYCHAPVDRDSESRNQGECHVQTVCSNLGICDHGLQMPRRYIKVRTKILRRSAISPHNYTLKWYLLRGHSLGINDHEKFRLDLRNEKAISFNFHSSDFQENIFKASCMVTRSNLCKCGKFLCGSPY